MTGAWLNLPGQVASGVLHQHPMQQALNAYATQRYQPEEPPMETYAERVERARMEALARASYMNPRNAEMLLTEAAKIEAWLLRAAEPPATPSAAAAVAKSA